MKEPFSEEKLQNYISQIEQLEDEKHDTAGKITLLYADAKSEGYDPRQCVRSLENVGRHQRNSNVMKKSLSYIKQHWQESRLERWLMGVLLVEMGMLLAVLAIVYL